MCFGVQNTCSQLRKCSIQKYQLITERFFAKTLPLLSAASSLTEYIEFGPPGAQGGLCGLTLVQRIIRQICIGDL